MGISLMVRHLSNTKSVIEILEHQLLPTRIRFLVDNEEGDLPVLNDLSPKAETPCIAV
jgi:hypothetical protein